jgi:N-acetyl-gamma-glutamyl-phosphate/LysW-gamma-L-alpha-aminoadipyl-6-phosphate reductase
VHTVHPNLRKATELKFTTWEELEDCDVLFTAVPHGTSMSNMTRYMEIGDRVIDLSADFRLRNRFDYPRWYGHEHQAPELLERFVYGIPEIHRDDLRGARYAAGPGCLATATILALYPLVKHGLIDVDRIVVDAKVGSSAAGLEPSPSSHHPERSHVVRMYAGTGHRHTAEIEQELAFDNAPTVSFTAHAIEMVRGIAATSHVFIREDLRGKLSNKDIWRTYRKEYGDEPFIRLVKSNQGVYRYPEPKILAGTNYCDIGFELDDHTDRLVLASAIDNLMKGAAGTALQCMNLMTGIDETAGLDALGLHPV